ncbi:hypothetical protein IAD21_05487 [Abditibacteriota bacterium]|nr:hypothetical protein IAD21_05487 [Abditibacteriota bacterium]
MIWRYSPVFEPVYTTMLRLLLTHLGHHFLKNSEAARFLDWKLGLRLLRDRRVPTSAKFFSLVLGLSTLFVLEFLELPIETALALLVPVLGLAADFALDGIELLAVPFFVATLILPFLAPRDIVAQLRGESEPQSVPIPTATPRANGFGTGQVYEATSATVR